MLLHLDAGANRSPDSVTRRLTALFVDTWNELDGSSAYRYRDLVADPVPPLDTAYCALGRRVERHGLVSPSRVRTLIENAAEEYAWSLTEPLIADLLAADTVLLGAPMYNYSVPAALKAWMDRVAFPGAFDDPASGRGRLRGTRIVVISPRGGAYRPGTAKEAADFHTPYLRAFFAKQGVPESHLSFVTVDLTLAGLAPHLDGHRAEAASSLAVARRRVRQLASDLAASAGSPVEVELAQGRDDPGALRLGQPLDRQR